jgi:hypothetical protein
MYGDDYPPAVIATSAITMTYFFTSKAGGSGIELVAILPTACDGLAGATAASATLEAQSFLRKFGVCAPSRPRSSLLTKATALVDLLEDRYRRGVVVVTSQVYPRGWLKLFEDAVVGEAVRPSFRRRPL